MKYFDNGFASFGEDKVDVAASKEGYFDRLVDFFGNFAATRSRNGASAIAGRLRSLAIPERKSGKWRMTRPLWNGFWPMEYATWHRVEHLAVGKDVFKDDLGGKGEAVFFDRPRPQFVNQAREC